MKKYNLIYDIMTVRYDTVIEKKECKKTHTERHTMIKEIIH